MRGGATDRIVQVLSVMGAAMQSFTVAIVLVFAFAIAIRVFPATPPGTTLRYTCCAPMACRDSPQVLSSKVCGDFNGDADMTKSEKNDTWVTRRRESAK
jgi:ABC-type dipeptide/oligopeptide/nickel transport system permease component